MIPASFNNDVIDSLNSRITEWADGLNSAESPIRVADCSSNAGFTTGMLRDGVHPNDEGDQFLAQQIGPLVIEAIEEVIASQ